MTTKLRHAVLRAREFCKKECLKPGEVETLLENDEILTIPETELKKSEYPIEEKTKDWLRRYKRYIKGEEDYCFYDPYLGLRIRRAVKGEELFIQDKGQLFFELDKHYNKKAINNIKKTL
ncbi:MAG: hypothetical protein Q7R52_00840 [archaeon]|nr:hypothetical protein [archaeon]